MGSSVASGFGEAIVLKTGAATEFGKLSKETAQVVNETAFQKGINRFTWLMIRFTFLLVFFIFVVNAIFKGNIIEALLFSLAIAIGLTPEMLPMIVTINLAKGAIDMARKKVIIKELASIQNFGAMDVLCADKTGTLTINDIVLVKHCDANGKENDEILRLAFLNSYYQSGLENLLDNAILNYRTFDLTAIKKIDELPFDFNRRIMSVIIEENGFLKLISKGAPEEIFKRSKNYLLDGKILSLDEEMKKRLKKIYEQFSQEGFRVLAIASRKIGSQEDYTDDDEKELTFAGFVAFLDPPKPTAANAIRQMNSLGIKFKILSGDNEFVCRKICSELKIPIDGVLGGEEIDRLSDFDLERKIEKTNIFSRLNPLQKEKIIKALKRKSHTVGYLGDGVNDAPSLKAADVGISVDNATDIAKETAQIILLEKNLEVLADCIAEGRKTFANIIKYIKMGSSSNFGNMISMAGASLFLPFLPMLPPQILLNNFLYDVSQVALPTDEVDKDYLDKPKPWNINFIKEFMIYIGPISSIFDFTTFAIMWYIFHATPELFHTGWFVESLATQVFVVYIIRTAKIPFIESRPSKTFLLTTLFIVILAALLPYTILGKLMGFVPLPMLFFLILVAIILTYLALVQIVKKWFIKKFGYE
jgi:Mg2+-importing ATPase